MRIVPAIVWKLDSATGDPLDPRLLPLLEAIAATSSLAAAVPTIGISYRAAWGLLRDYQRRLGVPLAMLERGRGATLTAAGERLVAAHATATRRLARMLPVLATDLDPPRREARDGTMRPLRIAASHDLALAALADSLADDPALRLELSFMGSVHALKEYAEGRADVAGFHSPLADLADADHSPLLALLDPRRDRLVRFVEREQGLILPPGNPARVKRFADIARQRLRFINRQRGSGTRLLIDRMLADERVDPQGIEGYGREEFTHPAVAATVASGGADAGFGLRAAAAQYHLGFVPLARERYFLAVRARDVRSAAVKALLHALRGAAFARLAKGLPGYRTIGAGSNILLDAIAGSSG
jgi:molybdate transport repressor ModE-like protein